MKFFILAKFTEPKLLDDGVDEKTKILNTYFNVTGGKIDKVKEIKRLQSELTLEDIQKHLVRERPRAKIIEFTILTKPNARWVQGEYYAHDYDAFVAGTVMSLKERKSAKGNPFAIIKFSDESKVYEIFIFSEILENNRDKLEPGKSFLLTVIKDKGKQSSQTNRFTRINVRKIVSLDEIIKEGYTNVHIEIDTSNNLEKLYESIKEKGNSKIKITIEEKDKKYLFELRDKRKFDYDTLKTLNKEPYIKKINV